MAKKPERREPTFEEIYALAQREGLQVSKRDIKWMMQFRERLLAIFATSAKKRAALANKIADIIAADNPKH